MINKNVYDHLRYKTHINKCNYPLTAANGTPLKIIGYTKLRIKIASEYINYFFIIVQNFSRSFILGRDFLYRNKVNFYTDLKKIKINGVYVPLANDTEICSVTRLSNSITLKPFTSYTVNMKAKKFNPNYTLDNFYIKVKHSLKCYFSPSCSFSVHCYFIAKCSFDEHCSFCAKYSFGAKCSLVPNTLLLQSADLRESAFLFRLYSNSFLGSFYHVIHSKLDLLEV